MTIRWLPDMPITAPEELARVYPHLRDSTHVDGLGPELHAIRTERAFGDWYAICSCEAMSLPYWARLEAEGWACPRHAAEIEIARNRQRWVTRVADATAAGYERPQPTEMVSPQAGAARADLLAALKAIVADAEREHALATERR